MKWELATIAATVLAVAGVSRRLTGTPVTPAMVFVLVGVLVGPLVLDEVTATPTGSAVRTLAEATLAVVLFADASRIKPRVLRREYAVPLRLLGIGLPLTIALGALLAALIFDQLNPHRSVRAGDPSRPDRRRARGSGGDRAATPVTDPAGAQRRERPQRRHLRTAAADRARRGRRPGQIGRGHHALSIVVEEIGYGILGGVAAGLAAAAVVAIGYRRDLITGSWLQVIPVAGAGLAYGVAAALGGSGFIAAFVAGAIFGALVSQESEQASRLNEELGGLLGGVTFLIFGAVLLGPALEHVSWQIALYAVLSLTLVRMLPVAIAMIGTGARTPTVGFLGWFGPRGLASIVFAVIVVEEAHLPGTETILLTTYLTIGLSVLAHGLTAAPLADRYAHWYESHSRDRLPAMESIPTPEHRTRGAPNPDIGAPA